MNLLIYCNPPKNSHISFSFVKGGMFKMALILDVSIFIPLSLTKNPDNFMAVTSNVLFLGFNLSLYILILRLYYHVVHIHFDLIVHHIK